MTYRVRYARVTDSGVHCGMTGLTTWQDAINRMNCYCSQGYRAFIVDEFDEVVK